MRTSYAVLTFLSMLIAASSGQEWLDGGYVSSSGYGDIGQYFADPIYNSESSGHYLESDPAIAEMKASMNRLGYPPVTAGSTNSISSQVQSNPGYNKPGSAGTSIPPTNIAGRWQFALSDGSFIDLGLSESQNMVFGRGIASMGGRSEWATTSGSLSGGSLKLDVVPFNATKLYRISLDLSHLPLAGTYMVYKTGAEPQPGALKASWLAA